MINRLSTKATDAERETSEAAAKRKREMWAMWFVIIMVMFSTTFSPLFGHLVRAPWARPYVIPYTIDFMRFLLVFSVAMIAVALWRVRVMRKRPRI
jgi:uncharacterized membrane protein YcjF (UPF0283 family)